MISVLFLLSIAITFDVAGSCKDYVNKTIKGTKGMDDGDTEDGRLLGCRKTCHYQQTSDAKDACVSCKDTKFPDGSTAKEKEDFCNSPSQSYFPGCLWKSGKCGGNSCPEYAKKMDDEVKCQKDLDKKVNECLAHNFANPYEYKDCDGETDTITNVNYCEYLKYDSKAPNDKVHKFYSAVCVDLGGCLYYKAKNRCSGLAIWALIVIIVVAVVVVAAIVVVVIIIILKLRSKPTTKVDPTPAAESKAAAAPVEAPPPEVVGPSVLIKLGKQEIRTKKAADGPTAVWGEAVVFTGLGAEDDDVVIEVNGNGGEVLGTAEQRIPEYVNNKKRAVLTLKNGEADAGVLEVDIEIQVQEEPEVKITGVFFVDKYTKPV